MSEKVQLKGGICELNFGYNVKMEVYTTLMSDIPKLCDMASDRKDIGKYLYNKKDIYFCIMLVSQLKKERNSYDIRIS